MSESALTRITTRFGSRSAGLRRGLLHWYPVKGLLRTTFLRTWLLWVLRCFQWYIAEGMLSLPTAKWSMVISFFSGVMASGFAFGCAKDTVEFFNAGIGEVRFPVGEGFLLVIFDYVGPWV